MHSDEDGWIVKMPFTTNSQAIWHASTMERVRQYINVAIRRFGDIIPYCMIQPKLKNMYEYKVIVEKQFAI